MIETTGEASLGYEGSRRRKVAIANSAPAIGGHNPPLFSAAAASVYPPVAPSIKCM